MLQNVTKQTLDVRDNLERSSNECRKEKPKQITWHYVLFCFVLFCFVLFCCFFFTITV